MPRKSKLTVEKLSKDINFFHGYLAECEILLPYGNEQLALQHIDETYNQDDLSITSKISEFGDVTLFINGYGEKQICSLINTISEDYNVIDCQLVSMTEC